MSLFSFGGSKSSSTQTSRSYAEDRARSENVAGGTSVSGSQQQQDIAFEDIFSQLYSGAAGAAGAIDPSALTAQANQLFGAGTGFLGGLGGDVGSQYLAERVGGESPVLQENIDALGADIGKFFSEQINPNITAQAVGGGALGGGRQGVAQGLAAEAAGKEFQRGALGLRTADIAARDQAAGQLGTLSTQQAQVGLGGLGGVADLASMASTAGLSPFAALSQILGGPTTLSSGTSFSSAEDFARGFSESFGFSRAASDASSSSKSIKLGF